MPVENHVRVLLIEDDDADAKQALTIFNTLGLEVQSAANVLAARNYLEDVAAGIQPAPHLIVLDLVFALESGFEVLRDWKSNPALQTIQIVVWTRAREQERKIAAYFNIAAVVQKSHGPKQLEDALKRVIAGIV
jgi:DNA-binding response OmpR family regulator